MRARFKSAYDAGAFDMRSLVLASVDRRLSKKYGPDWMYPEVGASEAEVDRVITEEEMALAKTYRYGKHKPMLAAKIRAEVKELRDSLEAGEAFNGKDAREFLDELDDEVALEGAIPDDSAPDLEPQSPGEVPAE